MIKRQMTFRQISELLDVPVVIAGFKSVQTKRGAFITMPFFYDYHRKVPFLPQTTRYMPTQYATK
jgi:hypothetical protein